MTAADTPAFRSIGEVLGLLREEFPEVTISKIRFLESQGLIAPERTPSGYRKFYADDVARLRWILRQQKDHFLPLRVIKERLDQLGDEAVLDDTPLAELLGADDEAAPTDVGPVIVEVELDLGVDPADAPEADRPGLTGTGPAVPAPPPTPLPERLGAPAGPPRRGGGSDIVDAELDRGGDPADAPGVARAGPTGTGPAVPGPEVLEPAVPEPAAEAAPPAPAE